MSRVDGFSFGSKTDLLQRHKQVQTNTHPFIEKERGKGRIQKKRKSRKTIVYKSFSFRNNWWLGTNAFKDTANGVKFKPLSNIFIRKHIC